MPFDQYPIKLNDLFVDISIEYIVFRTRHTIPLLRVYTLKNRERVPVFYIQYKYD